MTSWPHSTTYTSDAHIHVWRDWIRYDVGTTSATQFGLQFKECSGCGARAYSTDVTVQS